MILSNRSMCMIPHQSIILPPFSLSLVWLFWSSGQGMKRQHTRAAHVAKSKTGSNRESKSYNQIKMCMCVEFFVAGTRIPLLQNSPFYLLLRYELSFIFLFFSSHAFWGTNIYIFFFFFSQPKSFYMINIKSSVKKGMEHFYGWKTYTCVTSSVEVSI